MSSGAQTVIIQNTPANSVQQNEPHELSHRRGVITTNDLNHSP